MSLEFVRKLSSDPEECRRVLKGFIRVLDDDLSPEESEQLTELAYEMAVDRANDGAQCGKVPVGAPPNRSFDDWLRTCMFDTRLSQLREQSASEAKSRVFLTTFLTHHNPTSMGLIRCLSEDLREEAGQEVWARVLERHETFDPAKGSLVGWVHGIARHVAIGLLVGGRGYTRELDEQHISGGAHNDNYEGVFSYLCDRLASGDLTSSELAARREAHLQLLHRVCQRGGYPHQVFGFLISKALLGTTRENGTVQGSHGLTLKRYRDMRFHPQDGQSLYETYLDEFDKTSGLCGDDQFRGHHEEALRPLRDKLDDSTSVQDVLRERPQITADQEARFKSILGHLVRETCFAGYLSCYKKCPPGQSRDVYEAGIVGDWCNSVRKNVQEALRAGVGTVESPR